jgi:LPS sulfotransferase NodH
MRYSEWVEEIQRENDTGKPDAHNPESIGDLYIVEACLDGGLPHMRPVWDKKRQNDRWTVVCVTDRKGARRVCDLLHAASVIEERFSNKETMK